MSASQVDATPRPLPPRIARRSSANLKSTPPPPYIVSTPNVPRNESARPCTTADWEMRLNIPRSSPVTEEWLNEHSRGDLAQLLEKADEVIRERENDMGVTSAARKSLQEDSLLLKNRHEEFLRRLSSPSHSPSVSAAVSPASYMVSLPHTPHYYSANMSNLAGNSNTNEYLHFRRPRKISVSPHDIALLSDENAELLSKLEKFESESAQADLAGRRKLRKLEKEIQGLREELEQTQIKSEELEEKAKVGLDAGKVAEEMWRRKMEREEKLRAMRGKSGSDWGSDGVRDFAPGSAAISSGSSPNISQVKQVPVAAASALGSLPAFHFSRKPLDNDDQDDVFSDQPRSIALPERELAVVSQLLLKIRELEEANAQITNQQAKTAATLYSVQKDAEHIKRVYEGLGNTEGVEWEVIGDEDEEKGRDAERPAEQDTIRFQSFRRSFGSIPSKLMLTGEDHFADGIEGSMRSTVNSAALNRIMLNHKERKSVVGLFDVPGTHDLSSSSITTDSPIPFPTEADSFRPGWPNSGTLLSPTLSSLSIAMPSPINKKGPTLRSELGSEFGDEWGATTSNHHLRNTSLYQLAITSSPSSPVPISLPLQAGGTLDNVFPAPPEPQTASFRVRNGLQAPQDQFSQSGADGYRRGHQTDRYQRLSQTIRLRTNQWADGRFKETLLGSTDISGQHAESTEMPKPLALIPQRFVGVLDSAARTLAGSGDGEVGTSEHPADDDDDLQQTVVNTDSPSIANHSHDDKGLSKIIFGLWLWLQFCIIILVFLWAMAKRGPKNVFDDAEKRRASASRRS